MFRFDPSVHAYIDVTTGAEYPHITSLLKQAGLVDDTWFTPESRERGSVIHRWSTEYDLGAVSREDILLVDEPKYKGWFAAHVSAMDVIQPTWKHIEEPFVHEDFHYGGRPDRAGFVHGAISVLEIKSGAPEDAHPIQLALQAMLVESVVGLPADTIQRYGLYLKGNGRWKLEHYVNRRDFGKAREIVRRFC